MSGFPDVRAGAPAARRAREKMHEDAHRAARELMRDWQEQNASIVRRQIAELLDILDERIERRLQGANTLDPALGHNRRSYIRRALRRAGHFLIRHGQIDHEQAAHRVDPDVELIKAVLDLPKSLGITPHSSAPAAVDVENASAAEPNAHRLSGGAK